MKWKDDFDKIEQTFGHHKKKNWNEDLKLVRDYLIDFPMDIALHIRSLYLLHNILVEEICSDDEHDAIAKLLKETFTNSTVKFSNNPEYLFFIGKLLYVSEWYFGLGDDEKPIEERLAFQMQKKAFEKEPDNLLYEWSFLFSKNEKYAYDLSKTILHNSSEELKWLRTWGFPGKYMIDSIIYCFKNS